jgi:hypothetical protein
VGVGSCEGERKKGVELDFAVVMIVLAYSYEYQKP